MEKFDCVLNPDCADFNPLPAASCLLDPTLALLMLTPRADALLAVARQYVTYSQQSKHHLHDIMAAK